MRELMSLQWQLGPSRILATTATGQESRRAMYAAIIGILFSFCTITFAAAGGSGGKPSFVGSDACRACHAREYKNWTASHHHAAMQPANSDTVLGDFDNATFSEDGVTSTFFKKDGRFFVRTDGPDGQLSDFEVRYTFGLTPLQQYLVELPGGHIQALGIAWDSRPESDGGQRWYHLYPGRNLKPGDPLHWTGIDQNWNYQCAWCHSTNLQKNYDSKSRTFQTSWSEINVGCEACHGPASDHIEWAAKPRPADTEPGNKGFAVQFDERQGITWPMGAAGHAVRSAPRTTSKEIETCAQCHSRRQQISSDPADLRALLDAFRPATLDAGLYHADGQQRDEVYNYGSFLQSKMHAAGVTCSDCHDPHSGKLVVEGNGLCGQCHAAERFDTPAHHHHTAGSAGAKCASCHMPTATYMGIDARHDHSMRIPRPDRSILLGTPNACTHCHTGKSAAWAQEAVRTWYPASNPGAQNFADAFDLADRQAAGAIPALLKIASAPSSSGIAKASALSRLSRIPTAEAINVAADALKASDPLVRASAVSVVSAADEDTRVRLLAPLLEDPSRIVRMDAARALAGDPEGKLSETEKGPFTAAIAEYVAAQRHNAERPEAQSALATLAWERGNFPEARSAFQTALELDPTFIAAAVSLADLERRLGNEQTADDILRRSLATNPNSGPVQHALGLSLIRQKKTEDAMPYLSAAAKNAPEDPRFGYVLAIALHDTGKPGEAREVLKNTLARHPFHRDSLMALASYAMQSGQYSEALDAAQRLVELEPDRPEFSRLVENLKSRVK
jgi:Flp pilus assembly protein TadD